MASDVAAWMESVSGPGWYWYIKYLSGNDTLLNGSHQAGPYIPKSIILQLFPSIDDPTTENPRAEFAAVIDSHGTAATPRAIWYNNRLRGKTRNECRITNWGGGSSPILDPEATGSLCIFAFSQDSGRDVAFCRVWLCSKPEQEDTVQEQVGPVEPGAGFFYNPVGGTTYPLPPGDSPCVLRPETFPAGWRDQFPDASEVVAWTVERLPSARRQSPDRRLLTRRQCEFEIFRCIEEAVVLPKVRGGFASVDSFVEFAHSVTNRRKARSGASLELHARTIFDEESVPYSHGAKSEGHKRPDFLFPSSEAYRNASFPAAKLQMLAVKTTCKDRWRQVLNEADRIPHKHLLTLQEGVSANQLEEMTTAGVSLVVPAGLHAAYPKSLRSRLLTIERFIGVLRG